MSSVLWTRIHGGRPFPIPMRGNEIDDLKLDEGFRAKFPIPMRGNEGGRRAGYRECLLDEFPIPMRGNELSMKT